MKPKRLKKRVSSAAAALLAAILCVCPAAAQDNTRVIRIPYGFNDFLDVDEDGNVSGFYADYFDKLAQVCGWEYEYVEATWTDAMEMLENGDIDILYPTNYSDERETFMDFSDMPTGYIAAGIFALENSDYRYGDYASFDGARIAYVKNSSNSAELAAFAKEHGFTYESVYQHTNYEIIEALRSGEADLAIFNSAASFPGGILVSVMDAVPVYIAVRDGNTDLMKSVNRGMQQLLKNDSELVADTIKKTLSGNGSGIVAFTNQERAFIESGQEVTVGFYTESEPLSYVSKDGAPGGVYIEILEYLKDRTGLNIVPYPIDREKDWNELLKTGEIDFCIGVSDVVVSGSDGIRTTDAFMDYANYLVVRPDFDVSRLDKPVIALTRDRESWGDFLKEKLGKELEIRYYRTSKDCMLAVAGGKADAVLMNNMEFNYQSKNDRLSGLIQWTMYRFPTDIKLAADRNVDETMFSAVNKAMKLVTDEYADSVVEDCVNMPYDSYSAADILYNARIPLIIAGFALLTIAIIAAVVMLSRRKQAAIRKKAQEREQHQLQVLAAMTGDYDAIYFIDLDNNHTECMQLLEGNAPVLTEENTYSSRLEKYARSRVLPEYSETLLALCDTKEIIRRFEENKFISVRYRVAPGESGREVYEMSFVDVSTSEEGHKAVFGCRCIDDIVKEEQKQRQTLQNALDSADRANAAKSVFLSSMSHDIRTPMNAIIGMTSIAQAHADDPVRVRDSLSKISGAGQYLVSLINDVLDMSKIESGKFELAEEDIDLPALLDNCLNIIRPRIEECRHELRVYVRGVRHEAVTGDSLRLQQVFMNIMGNAVKYTPDGGKLSLTVRELPSDKPDMGRYEFAFRDNGIGMSKELQEHIFEPYSREEDQSVRKIQGTGLGMPITNNIVQKMDGGITIESEPGKGSVFTVTLYLKLRESGETAAQELAGLSVLAADGDPAARDDLCAMLDELGIKARACCSGREALEEARKGAYYAVILDRGTDGLETAKALKSAHKPPIVVLSGYELADIKKDARESGVDSFLGKPVFRSDIIRLFSGKNEHGDGSGQKELQSAHHEGSRVLLAEDIDLNREIVREFFGMTGISVDEAENGKAALDRFAASPEGYYDLVFMDIQMPVMNGYDAAKGIRALDRPDARTVPIIAMTADAFVEDIQHAKSAGMNEHIAKPINFGRLNEILTKYLG